MLDELEALAEQAEPREDEVRVAGELAQHRPGTIAVGRLAVDAAAQVNRRVDAERDRPATVHGARLALGVVAHERDRFGVGRVVLHVVRRHVPERDPQLLQDRAPLRRGRGEDERRGHACFFATQISSTGHLRDHSAEKAS